MYALMNIHDEASSLVFIGEAHQHLPTLQNLIHINSAKTMAQCMYHKQLIQLN